MTWDKRAKVHIAGEKEPGKPQRCIRCHAVICRPDWNGWEQGAIVASYGRGSWSKLGSDSAVLEPNLAILRDITNHRWCKVR